MADTTDQAANNTFIDQHRSQNNSHYDAEDQSSGSGTGLTANTWSGNMCTPAGDGSPEATCTN